MSFLENVYEQPEIDSDSADLLGDNLINPAINEQFSRMSAPSDRSTVVARLEQKEETRHNQLVKEFAEQIAKAGGLIRNDGLSSKLSTYIREQLDLDGMKAADGLGPEISQALSKYLKEAAGKKELKEQIILPEGARLEIVRDPNLEASQQYLAKLRDEPVYDYIRSMQLVDKKWPTVRRKNRHKYL